MRKILTVIPIRSGSEGIKDKNIRLLNGLPLVAHVIRAAKRAGNLEKIVVSTDSQDYASIANKYGAETPFIRPLELSSPMVRLHYVMKHALDYFDSIGENYDAVLSLQATTPLVKSSTIDDVVRKFHAQDCESVGTVSKIRHGHPYLSKRLTGENRDVAVDYLTLDANIARYPRQVRPDLYYFNGAVFLRDRDLLDNLDEATNCLGFEPRVIIMDDIESINIDEEIDFEIAEYLLRKQDHPDDVTK